MPYTFRGTLGSHVGSALSQRETGTTEWQSPSRTPGEQWAVLLGVCTGGDLCQDTPSTSGQERDRLSLLCTRHQQIVQGACRPRSGQDSPKTDRARIL